MDGHIWFDHSYPPEHGYGYVAASRFKNTAGIYLFGKVRRTDWLPVRETRHAMEQDQVDRSEECMSEYNSEEEAMVIPRGYDGDDQHCISGDSSDTNYSYLDADAMEEGYLDAKAYFDGLRAMHSRPDYQPTGSLIADSYA